MIDTHVHLDALGALGEGPALLQAAVAVGVTGVLSLGIDPRKDQRLQGAVPAGLQVRTVLGLHPQEVTDVADLDDALRVLQARLVSEDVAAVGEMGLDARPDKGNAALHEEAFRRQLRLARAHHLPVVLHCVRRDGRLLEVLDDEQGSGGPWRGVWHGFGGSKDTMLLAVKRGLSIAVGHLVLAPHVRRLREAVPHIPDDRLLIETDAPPLEPRRLADVVSAIALLRNTTAAHVADVSSDNARRLFGF